MGTPEEFTSAGQEVGSFRVGQVHQCEGTHAISMEAAGESMSSSDVQAALARWDEALYPESRVLPTGSSVGGIQMSPCGDNIAVTVHNWAEADIAIQEVSQRLGTAGVKIDVVLLPLRCGVELQTAG